MEWSSPLVILLLLIKWSSCLPIISYGIVKPLFYYGIVKLLPIMYHGNGQVLCQLYCVSFKWSSHLPIISYGIVKLLYYYGIVNSSCPLRIKWKWSSPLPIILCIIKWSSCLPILSYGIVKLLYCYGIVKLLPITYERMVKPLADYLLWNGQALAHYVGIINVGLWGVRAN
jgi:hypothetical protein